MSEAVAVAWVVDDGAPDKRAAGGPVEFAAALAEATSAPAGHAAACPTCALAGEDLACVGLVHGKLSARAEEWLAGRLPYSLESLPGLLLRQSIEQGGVKGDGGAALRRAGLCEAPGPFSRHWGPFFRRVSVTTDQLLELLFAAGDVQPPHGLGVLIDLGALVIDGVVPETPEHGPRLGELIERPTERRERVLFGLAAPVDADASTRELVRYLRALWAAFVLDDEVRVISPT